MATKRMWAAACVAAAVMWGGVEAAEPLRAALTVEAGTKVRAVSPLVFGHNMEWVWGGQGLFRKDGSGAVEGLAPLIASLRPGLIRYPGGSLSNTFRFADSLGALADRNPVANFFTIRGDWKGKVGYQSEKPLLGFDDLMRFVEETKAQGAMVTVNCTWWPQNPEISGTAQEAAAWVAYANAKAGEAPAAIGKDARGTDWRDSRHWAELRARNGREKPYGVAYWEIGNEVYAPEQGAGMTPEQYAQRAVEFAGLMKSVDPTIRVGAVLDWERPDWNRAVMRAAKPGIDFFIVHTYGPGVTGQTLALWDTGSRDIPVPVRRAGRHTISIEASGQPAKKEFPRMRVALDGRTLGEYTVDASKWENRHKAYAFTAELAAGEHTLTVSFLNDEYAPPDDRNLFIEGVYLGAEDGRRERLTLIPQEEMMRLLSAHTELLGLRLERLRRRMEAAGLKLPVHVTEYNAMYGQTVQQLEMSRDLKSAVYAARHVQKFLQDPSVEGANFWCIKSAWFLVVEPGPGGFRLSPAGEVFRSLAPLARGDVVRTTWTEQPASPVDIGTKRAPWVEAAAVRDGATVAVNVVAWHPTLTTHLELTIRGAEPTADSIRVMTVTGPNPDARNGDGKPAVVTLRESTVKAGRKLALELPPVSATTILCAVK